MDKDIKITCACGKLHVREGLAMTGTIRVYSHPAGSDYKKHGKLESETRNLIMTGGNIGRDLLIQWLLGIATYPVGISWGGIGTSNTAVTATDTQLGAEINRTSPSYTQDYAFNEAIVQFFFPDAVLTAVTYYEFGTFVGGTSSANTGQIFNHALFGTPYTKVAGQDTTVEVDITLT